MEEGFCSYVRRRQQLLLLLLRWSMLHRVIL
jgi:hypothetical protein